ncbi:MarR family transcriptional regulator [soil metagenome]
MPSPEPDVRSGYWYAEGDGRADAADGADSADRDKSDEPAQTVSGADVLNALRTYRAAESEMRRRTQQSIGVGETDLAALRFLLQAQRRDQSVTPKALAERLGISSASVTVLIDRLAASGHLERRPHPTDGRSKVIVSTPSSDDEVRANFGELHRRMIEVAGRLTAAEAAVVTRFLTEMTAGIELADVQNHSAASAEQ